MLEDTPEMKEKIRQLPVSFIWGVGRVTDKALLSYGIKTIGDLFNVPLETLKARFGEAMGQFMHDMASGLDIREVIQHVVSPNQWEERSHLLKISTTCRH